MEIKTFNLGKIITKNKETNTENGVFIPVWRNWDSQYSIKPEMVYYTTITPGQMKGPHLHKKRTSNITCVSGKVALVLKSGGNYKEVVADSENPATTEVLPGTGLLVINIGSESAALINICSPAWHPDEPDNFADDYSDYNFSKWQTATGGKK